VIDAFTDFLDGRGDTDVFFHVHRHKMHRISRLAQLICRLLACGGFACRNNDFKSLGQ